jgi:2-aminoadipate transaminase
MRGSRIEGGNMKFENLLAERTERMKVSAIREILKVVSQPGMISLAGGIPAPESFPLEIMQELVSKVFQKYGTQSLQYDRTEGFIPFLESLVPFLEKKHVHTSADKILVASGSQGVLDAVGRVLISPGDKVAVESPTYLGALQAFNPYEPDYVCMDTDDDGLIPESLENVLKRNRIKFTYLVPTFQNPTGRTIPLERRKQIADIIQHYDALLLEDDPYSALRYRGPEIPPIAMFAPDNVIYTTTLSKVLAPGLRLGVCVAPEIIRQWLVIVKQGVDLHTSTFNQALASEYLSGGYLDRHLPKIINIYRPKQEAMLQALQDYFPPDFRWSKPEGGMFLWVEGPKGFDMEKLYWKSAEHQVVYVPGKFFFAAPGEGLETMRLNYTMSDEATIRRAVEILAGVINQER